MPSADSKRTNAFGNPSIFTISLPILPLRLEKKSDEPRVHPTAESIAETPVKAAPDSAPELAGLKILLVDDEAEQHDLLKIVLLGGGAEVVEAESAAGCSARLRACKTCLRKREARHSLNRLYND